MSNRVESRVACMRRRLYDLLKACITEVNGLVQDLCRLKVAL